MNRHKYLEELNGVTFDMHRDTGSVPDSTVFLWYRAVGLDDPYLEELFGHDADTGREFLINMYCVREWPEHK